MKSMSRVLAVVFAFLLVANQAISQEIIQAVKDGNLGKVKELIEKDTSLISLKDQSGRTPFHWAAASGHIEIASYLLDKGSDIDNRNASQSTPLHAAASVNNPKMAAWLIEHGADIQAKNNMGWTPLFWAAQAGRKELIELFLKNGAEANAKDLYGYTSLDLALAQGNKEAIDVLLDNGAIIDLSGEKAVDALQTAARNGVIRVFNMVVEKGGNHLFSDQSQNKTIMNNAIGGGSVEIVKTLLAKGIPLELEGDEYGLAPIHFAAEGGHVVMLEYLIQRGADINQRTLTGKSAYNIAAGKNSTEFMNAVIKWGGNSDPQKFPLLEGLYLGQKPPGKMPVRFAPGIVSTASHEFSCCFSPDGKEFYFARRLPELMGQAVIMFSKRVNGTWTEPAIAPFVNNQYTFEPFITPDNKRLYFQWGKVVSGALQMFTMYVDRMGNDWGEMKDPGEPFNPGRTMHISAAANGTLYTTDISGGMTSRTNLGSSVPGNECLGILKPVNGRYEKLEKMGPPLDKYPHSQHPWIAPDENYMIYTVTESGQQGKGVLYFSQKGKDGHWTEPRRIPLEINAGQPFITPDGKYLFFTSMDQEQGDLYWVSTQIIEELRSKQ